MGLDRYPCPTGPGSRPRIPRYWLGAACTIEFGIRESNAIKESYGLLWCPNTYDLPWGLALGNHSSSLSSAAVELSGRRVFPFLDPPASPVGAAFLFLSPLVGGGASSSSSSSLGGECAAESSDGESDDAWRRALFRAPLAFLVFSGTLTGMESTSSPEERLRGLRAKEPDSRSVRPSSASPVKGTGV